MSRGEWVDEASLPAREAATMTHVGFVSGSSVASHMFRETSNGTVSAESLQTPAESVMHTVGLLPDGSPGPLPSVQMVHL